MLAVLTPSLAPAPPPAELALRAPPPAFHPEASPGPQDSHYLFDRFVALMER